MILVSHSMEDVARYADRLIVLGNGTIAFDGTPKEVFLHAEELEEMTEDAVMRLYLLEDMLIKKIVCGGVKKNMTLGRLEQTIEFTAVVTVGMGTGVSE